MPGTVATVAGARGVGPCAATVSASARAARMTIATILGNAVKTIPSRARRGFANRGHGLRDDEVDADPAELRARALRIAVDAFGRRLRVGVQPLGADQVRVDRERERRVG